MTSEYIKNYKKEIMKCINELKNKNTVYKQIPNLLTFSRAALIPISSILFLTNHPIIGIIYTVLIEATDLFDGRLARKWNVQSKFGADLDAFCDKVMFLSLSIPLIISYPLVLINFLLEASISIINVIGRIKGLNTKTVFSGKVKTCFLSLMLISGYLVKFFELPLPVLNILIGITFITQIIALINYIKEYKKMNKEHKSKKSI